MRIHRAHYFRATGRASSVDHGIRVSGALRNMLPYVGSSATVTPQKTSDGGPKYDDGSMMRHAERLRGGERRLDGAFTIPVMKRAAIARSSPRRSKGAGQHGAIMRP